MNMDVIKETANKLKMIDELKTLYDDMEKRVHILDMMYADLDQKIHRLHNDVFALEQTIKIN